MSLLSVGAQCHACHLVDFLPFPCPHCTNVFCKEHIHGHGCIDNDNDARSTGPSVKRRRGVCALERCGAETIESIGGLELDGDNVELGGGEAIAREVRCKGCGQAFCPQHRSQSSHSCSGPHELHARNDAALARRAKAQEILKQTMPAYAGKERLVMPKQIDKTRSKPTTEAPVKTEDTSTSPPTTTSTPSSTPLESTSSSTQAKPTPTTVSASLAEEKLYNAHAMTIRSLSKPLEARYANADRSQSIAIEWTVDEKGDRVKSWLAAPPGKYNPKGVATSLSGGPKATRNWVPHNMPGGRLFDILVAQSKVPRMKSDEPKEALSILRITTQPGHDRAAVPLDLGKDCQGQLNHGDVLVIVRGWGATS